MAREYVNIFSTIYPDELDMIEAYGCKLHVTERNEDGTIGPHVSGELEGEPNQIKSILTEFDMFFDQRM